MPSPQPMRDLMIRAGHKARNLPVPERYLWVAVWWHLYSKETMAPDECLTTARGQLRLARDMAERAAHYRVKPASKTDWEWSGLTR